MPKKNKKKNLNSFFDDLEDSEPATAAAPKSGGDTHTKGKKKGQTGSVEELNKFGILDVDANASDHSDVEPLDLDATASKSKENGQYVTEEPDEDGGDGLGPSSTNREIQESGLVAAKGKRKKLTKGKKNLEDAFAFLEEDDHCEGLDSKPAGDDVSDGRTRSGDDRDQEIEGSNNSIVEDKGNEFQSGFAVLAVDDEEDCNDEDIPTTSTSKKKGAKKGKKSSDMDSIFAALGDEGEDRQPGSITTKEAADVTSTSTGGKAKGKKKTKAAKMEEEREDLDSMFAALGEDDGIAAAVTSSTPEPAKETKGKKKKKGKKPTKDEEDFDTLLKEIDGPPVEDQRKEDEQDSDSTAACGAQSSEVVQRVQGSESSAGGTAVASSGKNQKEEEQTPKSAAEIVISGSEQTASSVKVENESNAATSADVAGQQSKDLDEGNGSQPGKAEAEGGKELSGKEKKKLKKKQKEKEKKLAKAATGDATSEAKPKGKEKKPSAQVRRMQEEMERRRLEEERLKKEEEERIIREEEERKRQEEEERLRKEEQERKKKEKAERMKQQKILMKQKEEEERRARALERLNISKQTFGDKNDGRAQEKISFAEKRKQRLQEAEARKKAEEELRLTALEEERKRKEELRKQVEEEAARKKAEHEREAAADDWEDVADTWEDIDEEKVAVKAENGNAVGEVVNEKPGAADDNTTPAAGSSQSTTDEEATSEEESSSYETDSEEERERLVMEAKQKREARVQEAKAQASMENLRSPICCILGHVDTGKTKILDNIRRTNVQDGEAGGITQQIGATYIPQDAIMTRTEDLRKGREYDMKVPGLLVIDTPGHESFTNLRSRGSGLCDIAILVVDLMHGLEPQTIESLSLLRNRKTPFIVALNKVDRLLEWKITANAPIRDSVNRQRKQTTADFEDRLKFCTTQLMEQGLNVALYWKNKDPRKFVSMVPTSAITGEGIPDLLQLLVKLTTAMMQERLMFLSELQCTVLEVKAVEGLGTTIDVVLVNGILKEGDKIVVCGLAGPIVTTIRSLLTPHPLKELRVKGSYLHHKEIQAAQGIKICAQGLEHAVAGTALYVVGVEEEEEELTALAQEEMEDVLGRIDKSGEGVSVQASTLGSLEALLDFLKTPEVAIPVSAIAIGPVHKKDVIRANVMNEKGLKKFGVILAFDVPVSREAREVAQDLGVRIFTADIIYHLFDQFKAYMEEVKKAEKMAARDEAVFPCILRIMPTCVFNKKDPIVLGVEVVEGQARIGSPLCIPASAGRPEISLGRIESMEVNHKMIEEAKGGDSFAVKIRATNAEESAKLYGRHFDHNDELYSRITRESIDALKQFFRDEMDKEGWRLVVKLKSVFKIQ